MTKLVLKDRQTILIGGLISKQNEAENTRIPVLSDIPLVRNMFRSKSRRLERTELVLFLTPFIVNTTSELRAFTDKVTALLSNVGHDELLNSYK